MGTVFWFALSLVMMIFEASTLGLFCIWFAAGALVSAILALVVDTIWIQWLVFVLVSGVTLVLLRPFFVKKVNAKVKDTNIAGVIGERGRVEAKIDNLFGPGEVLVKGQKWLAISKKDDEVIEAGASVKILEIQGVKLVVEEERED